MLYSLQVTALSWVDVIWAIYALENKASMFDNVLVRGAASNGVLHPVLLVLCP